MPWLPAILLALVLSACAPSDALRVYLVAPSGPPAKGEPDVARFASEWRRLLSKRGVVVKVGSTIPSARQLEKTQVLVLYGRQAASFGGEEVRLRRFIERGGGLVLLHDAVSANDPEGWFATVAGGTAVAGATNWPAGLTPLCFGTQRHRITEGLSNFDLDDGSARNVQLAPEAQVLMSTFNEAGGVVPQAWVLENDPHRTFVALVGRRAESFSQPSLRGMLLRAIAWAGRREPDVFVRDEERAHFAYPPGGPTLPEKAAARIRVPSDFNLMLVASEPLIAKPLALDWDARGRLWVAVAPGLPTGGTNGFLKDGVLILEDTNGDGKMDVRRVFFEGVRPVTALVCYRDGVILAQPPQILLMADRDGDGTPDQREALYEGFGTNDLFPTLTGFRWGLDGWIYGVHRRSGTNAASIGSGEGRSFGPLSAGLIRFKPDGSAIEMVLAFTNSSGGFDFTWDGELLLAKAGGPHLSYLVMGDRFLGPHRPPTLVLDKAIEDHQKISPLLTNRPGEINPASLTNSFRASAGALVYDGGAWPMKYLGSYLVCEPGARVVHEDILSLTEGQSYESTRRDEEEFIASADPWFRPIEARLGPDGAVYLLDFYSLAPFAPDPAGARPDRDSTLGRIWRLQHQNARRLDVPVLDKAPPSVLIKALEHPNRWVRATAQRLLVEQGDVATADRLVPLLTNRLAQVRVHALWTLRQLDALPEKGLANALTNSAHLFVQRAALRLTEDLPGPLSTNLAKAVVRQFKDVDERTRLLGLLALYHSAAETNVQQTALRMFPDLKDPYCRAVVLALARQAPMEYLKAAFASDKSEHYRELATPLVESFAQNQKTNEAAEVIRLAAAHLKDAEKLNAAVLQTLGKRLGPEFEPAWSPELEDAIKKILSSKSRTVQLANLPLATHWPHNLTLLAEAEKTRDAILAELKNPKLKDEERVALVTNLFSVTWLRPQLLAELEGMLGPGFPPPVQKQIITELARMPEKGAGAILIRKYALFTGELRPVLFAAVLKYPEWALALLEAIGRKEIPVKDLDVLGINRLRTYPDKAVVEKAVAVFDAVGGAPRKDRAAVALGLKAVLSRPGNADLGRPIYRQHCLGCHKFPGHAPVPEWSIDLTAATILGPASLLDRVLDPNRAASPRWLAWNASTTNGGRYFGMLARDTKDSVVIRNVEGDHEIKRADLARTNCTGVSFMPEGYEMLGAEDLRNLLAYVMRKTSNGFQIISLTNAFTADSRRSFFGDPTNKPEIEFKRFGMVMVASNTLPFHLVPPAGTPKGCNLVVLKGGAAQHLPQQVEVPVNVKARELHVLGGVAAWGYPSGETNLHDMPAAKLTLHYADAETEEIILRNGDQFADYVRQIDVPGSKYVPDLLVDGQLRWFTLEPKRQTKIDKLTIESFNNHLAPVFVALTAQQ